MNSKKITNTPIGDKSNDKIIPKIESDSTVAPNKPTNIEALMDATDNTFTLLNFVFFNNFHPVKTYTNT
jgi:hypothetical protein